MKVIKKFKANDKENILTCEESWSFLSSMFYLGLTAGSDGRRSLAYFDVESTHGIQ